MQEQKTAFPTAYPWPKLTKLYETGKLSHEELSEQLLLWGQILYDGLMDCQRQLEEQEDYIADLVAQVAQRKGLAENDSPPNDEANVLNQREGGVP